MSIRILKKALGLLIVDIVIIIGIFVLQFRTDSNIIKKIGNLHITLAGAEGQDGESVYKNKLRVSYNGINFFCDDNNLAMVKKDGEQVPVYLTDWKQLDDLSCEVEFTEGVKVTFELASTAPDSSLAIMTELPTTVSSFLIPYNYASNLKLQKSESNSLILGTRKIAWELAAYSVVASYAEFNRYDSVATYAVYDENKKFSFESIADQSISSGTEYVKNIAQFKKNLIASFDSNTVIENITEQVAVSYTAALAENGNYNRALEKIPDSVKKSRQRTWLSAPYMNTLEDMNADLDKTLKEYEKKINDSAYNGSFDLYTTHKLSDFLYIHPEPNNVTRFLQNTAAANIEELSIAQITGIIQTYVDLLSLKPSYAAILEPAMESCITVITESCSFDNNILTISENGTFLSVIQAVETGIALLRYGTAIKNDTLIHAGYALVNSYISENTSFDLRTLANLYPIVAYDNQNYPHLEKVYDDGKKLIWAWTCANKITCNIDGEESVFTIDFPEGSTHYVIFRGIEQFNSIYIYDMAFRTDPRFETYNSSGYVYKKNNNALLLKSRHKQQNETVRLIHKETSSESAPAPSPVKSVKTESVSENPVTPASSAISASPAVTPSEKPAEESEESENETINENVIENASANEVTPAPEQTTTGIIINPPKSSAAAAAAAAARRYAHTEE